MQESEPQKKAGDRSRGREPNPAPSVVFFWVCCILLTASFLGFLLGEIGGALVVLLIVLWGLSLIQLMRVVFQAIGILF